MAVYSVVERGWKLLGHQDGVAAAVEHNPARDLCGGREMLGGTARRAVLGPARRDAHGGARFVTSPAPPPQHRTKPQTYLPGEHLARVREASALSQSGGTCVGHVAESPEAIPVVLRVFVGRAAARPRQGPSARVEFLPHPWPHLPFPGADGWAGESRARPTWAHMLGGGISRGWSLHVHHWWHEVCRHPGVGLEERFPTGRSGSHRDTAGRSAERSSAGATAWHSCPRSAECAAPGSAEQQRCAAARRAVAGDTERGDPTGGKPGGGAATGDDYHSGRLGADNGIDMTSPS